MTNENQKTEKEVVATDNNMPPVPILLDDNIGTVTKFMLSMGSSWFVVYGLIPLIPFILATTIKYSVDFSFSLNHFDASDLALSVGFIAFLARESLLRADLILSTPEKVERVHTIASWLVVGGSVPLGFFIALEIMSALEKSVSILQYFTLIWFIIIMLFINDIQKSFGLEARMK